MTHFGIARADGIVTDPVGTTPEGYPIYERVLPQGFFVFVEARRGLDFRPIGTNTFNHNPGDPSALPDFLIIANRALGNGSTKVCDDGVTTVGTPGGVPAVVPPAFGGSQATANAINDFACRFSARTAGETCTRDFSSNPIFVDPTSTLQFCPQVGIGSELAFGVGDTLLTVRIRNTIGQLGPSASIVVRVLP